MIYFVFFLNIITAKKATRFGVWICTRSTLLMYFYINKIMNINGCDRIVSKLLSHMLSIFSFYLTVHALFLKEIIV